jgi:hypothetical protein
VARPSAERRGGPHLVDLVDRGLIRVIDLAFIAKEEDGTVAGLELADLGGEDIGEAAGALEPGTSAALLVFENTWAAPFAAAVRRSGGQLVASGRTPSKTCSPRSTRLRPPERRRSQCQDCLGESPAPPSSPAPRPPSAAGSAAARNRAGPSRKAPGQKRSRWPLPRPPPTASAPAGEDSLINQLKQLGELKDQGILT